jgi:phthalate 4,5-cis-dihydrodiol dehydrogenase
MLAFGTRELSHHQPYQPHFGLLIVTCAEAEIRLSPQGIIIHDSRGAQEVTVPREKWRAGHGDVLTMLWEALRRGRVPLQDAVWGRNTIAALRCIELSYLEDRGVDVQLFAKDNFNCDTS